MMQKKKTVAELKKRFIALWPILPGSLNKQWNVCGSPGCKCKDIKNPAKHGPYYQLSYTLGGKSSTVFVKKSVVQEVRRRIQRHKEFKQLCNALIEASIDAFRKYGVREEQI